MQRSSFTSSLPSRRNGPFCTSLKCLVCLLTFCACLFLALVTPNSPLFTLPALPSHTTHTATHTHTNTQSHESNDAAATTSTTATSMSTSTTISTSNLRTNVVPPAANTHTSRRVAVAITVTKDGPFLDGALVLGHSARRLHRSSRRRRKDRQTERDYNTSSSYIETDYELDLVALVTDAAPLAAATLRRFGWVVLQRALPVPLAEVQNENYAQRMADSGCCGADEFLKLWAYSLTQYWRVAHLDMDAVLLRPLDELFFDPQWDKELLFTGDYGMKGGSPVVPVQGGFLVIRPSLERFEELRAIIRKGDHREGSGWGGSHIGNFWGGQTIQGILPYYYHTFHPQDAKELNRCKYNHMADNPYHKGTTRCLDGQPTCEDCRISDPETVHSVHFTICQKPWTCTAHTNPKNMKICLAFHKKWFEVRDEFEKELGIDPSYRPTRSVFKESLHMCKGYGDDKYFPLPIDKITKQPEY